MAWLCPSEIYILYHSPSFSVPRVSYPLGLLAFSPRFDSSSGKHFQKFKGKKKKKFHQVPAYRFVTGWLHVDDGHGSSQEASPLGLGICVLGAPKVLLPLSASDPGMTQVPCCP